MSFQKGSRIDKTRKQNSDKHSNPFSYERHWIGSEANRQAAPAASSAKFSNDRNKNEWIEREQQTHRTERKPQAETRITVAQESNISKGINIGNKTPIELMQDILKGVRQGQQIRSYYSKEAEQSLSELLTNKFKLNNYIKKLEQDMVGLDSKVVKNYEVLVLLLQQVSNSDVEVKHGEGGMEIKFNRGIIQRQQAQIERLEKQKQQRQKQMKYVIDEYESIIFNFNDVIQKLVNRQEGRHNKQKF